MPRGMYTQCFSILVKEPVSIEAVEQTLGGFPVHGHYETAEHWAMHGPCLSLAYRPDVNGLVLVDVVDQPWPDEMGDAKNESPVSMAWMTGQFGPLANPGSLQRAMKQCWPWKDGRTLPAEHKGFVRLRCTYTLGLGEDAPLLPPNWDGAAELQYLTTVADAVLTLPGAMCYFNPNGETLRDLTGLRAAQDQAKTDGILPIELWTNVRLYPYEGDWVLMDTVGNCQLNAKGSAHPLHELRDIEGLYRNKKYDFGEVDHFLRDLTLYMHERGEVIKDGDTVDGPGNVPWKATLSDRAVAMPPRPVIRVVPQDGAEAPATPA